MACMALFPIGANAQVNRNYYGNVDWNFNSPLSNSFTKVASGWGMNFDGGYYVTPKIGIGLFLSFSTNHKYIGTETLTFTDGSSLTTNQQRSMFQLPFGAEVRYNITNTNRFTPYVDLRLGTEYCQLSSYISTFKVYNRNWGFYVSPEIGSTVWTSSNKTVGLHVALYYSFSTNKGDVLDGNIDKLNNIGFRLGISF